MKGVVKAAERIKKKYKKQKIGQLNKQNKTAADWLKQAGYLDTKDLDAYSTTAYSIIATILILKIRY